MKRAATTREKVLDAALASFAQRGYEATSLDSVAVVSGVRKQTILYHFTSKEGLLDAVIDGAVADLVEVLFGAEAQGPAGVVDAALRLGATRPELLELARELVRLGPPASTRLFSALEPLRVRAAARLPEHQVTAMAAMVIGLATEVEVLRSAGIAPDIAWLRRRRRAVLAEFTA